MKDREEWAPFLEENVYELIGHHGRDVLGEVGALRRLHKVTAAEENIGLDVSNGLSAFLDLAFDSIFESVSLCKRSCVDRTLPNNALALDAPMKNGSDFCSPFWRKGTCRTLKVSSFSSRAGE